MKRSEVNNVIREATAFFEKNGWTLPPKPKWDITDFGLGDFLGTGLTLINLAEEKEYCEKLMYAVTGQKTPSHCHRKKKEDIICRKGVLCVQLWKNDPKQAQKKEKFEIRVNGKEIKIKSGEKVVLQSGERVTIEPGIWHEFYPQSKECIIGEVSTANDDVNDNFFSNMNVGRFSEIVEDEPALVKLIHDK